MASSPSHPMHRAIVLIAVIGLTAPLTRGAAGATSYSISTPGLLPGGSYTWSGGLNNSGQMAGYGDTAAGVERAFLWSQGGSIQNLGTPSGWPGGTVNLVQAYGINGNGAIVGTATYPGTNLPYATLWTSGGGGLQPLTALAPGAGAAAFAINNAGQIVGESGQAGTSIRTAVLWNAGTPQNLGAGTGSVAYDINTGGTVVGQGKFGGISLAFRWSAGSLQSLGTLAGDSSSFAQAINDNGQMAGTSNAGSVSHAVMWSSGGVIQALGSFGGNSFAYDINAAGTVVGSSYIDSANTVLHALLWNGSGLVDLNTLMQGSGWELNEAFSINDVGQIAGVGLYNGQQMAFLLTPVADVPEPTTAALLGAGLLGLGLFRRRWRLAA